jgi:hypothetical protein
MKVLIQYRKYLDCEGVLDTEDLGPDFVEWVAVNNATITAATIQEYLEAGEGVNEVEDCLRKRQEYHNDSEIENVVEA